MKLLNQIRSRAPLQIEFLEDRCVPAGNLEVFVTDGTLYIIGDKASNDVKILDLSSTVYVLNEWGTINKTQSGVLILDSWNEVHHIVVQTHGGNDRVFFYDDSEILQKINLEINTGEGSDSVVLGIYRWIPEELLEPNFLSLQGNMKINTGSGNDTLVVDGSYFNTLLNFQEVKLEVEMSGGNDSVEIMTAIAIHSLNGGKGREDSLNITNILFEQYLGNISGFETLRLY